MEKSTQRCVILYIRKRAKRWVLQKKGVGTGIKGWVGTGIKGWVGTGIKGWVGTGIKGWVGTGIKGWVGTGIKGWVGTGIKGWVGTGIKGWVGTGIKQSRAFPLLEMCETIVCHNMAALKYHRVDSTESFNLYFFEPSQPALPVY